METVVLKHNVIIRREDKYFIADVPSLGISDFGKTIEEAKKTFREKFLKGRCGVLFANQV